MQKNYVLLGLIACLSLIFILASCSLDEPTGPSDAPGDGNNSGGDSGGSRVGYIELTAEQDGSNTTSFIIQATVYNTQSQILQGVTVNFTTTEGDFQGGGTSISRTTDVSGKCFVILETDQTAIVTATAGGVTATITVSFTNTYPVASLSVNPSSATAAQTIYVTLDASNSFDAEGDIELFTFEAFPPAGITVTGIGSTQNPVIPVTINGATGINSVITFTVTVRDGGGLTDRASATFTTVE